MRRLLFFQTFLLIAPMSCGFSVFLLGTVGVTDHVWRGEALESSLNNMDHIVVNAVEL